MVGGRCWLASFETHSAKEAVVWPPRPSETATVTWQLLQAAVGSNAGVKRAVDVPASSKVPEQVARHEYVSESPSASEAEAESVVCWPTSR